MKQDKELNDITRLYDRFIRQCPGTEEYTQRLAEESAILSPSLSRILARFTEDGVVVRKADKQDQRAQSIRLSAKGKRLHDRVHPKISSKYKSVEDLLGGDTVAKLQSLLKNMSTSLPDL